MDVGTVRGLITLALMLAFIGLLVHVYSRGRRAEFDAAARLPLEEPSEHDLQCTQTRGDHR